MRRERPARRGGYRSTVRLVREYLRPVEPPPRLVVEIRDLRRAFGEELPELLMAENRKRRGRRIALAFTLPFFGMASYLLARFLLHRQEAVSRGGMTASA